MMTNRSYPNLPLLWLSLCLLGLVQSSHAQQHTNFINQRRKPLTDRIRMSMIHELAPRMASYSDSSDSDDPSGKKSQKVDKRAKHKITRGTKGSDKANKKMKSKSGSESAGTQQTAPTLSPVFYTSRAPQAGIPTFPPLMTNGTTVLEPSDSKEEDESTPAPNYYYPVEEEEVEEEYEEVDSDEEDDEEEESEEEEVYSDSASSSKSKGKMMMGSSASSKTSKSKMMMMSKSKSRSSSEELPITDFPTFSPTIESSQEQTGEPTSNFTGIPTTNTTAAPTLPAGNITMFPTLNAGSPNVTVSPIVPNATVPPLVPNATIFPVIPNTTTTPPNTTIPPTIVTAMARRSAPIKELDWADIASLEWTMVGEPLQGTSTAGHRFRYKVDMSNDATKLAVSTGFGSPMYLYERAPHTDQWMQLLLNGVIKASDGILTVSGDGSTLAVKSGPVVYIHKRIEQDDGAFEWVALGGPLGRNGEINAGAAQVGRESNINRDPDGSQFGDVIVLSYDGTTVAIGDPADNDLTGWAQVYAFDAIANAWRPSRNPFIGYTKGGHFGNSLALSQDGRTFAVCAIQVSYKTGPGYCQIHRFVDGAWTQLGKDIIGQADMDSFGRSVALSADGNTMAVGAEGHDINGLEDFGRAYVFSYDPDQNLWPQVGGMIDGKHENQRLGHSIDLSGDGTMLIVGAWAQGVRLTGYAEVYKLADTPGRVASIKKWIQVGQVLTNDNDFDNYGCSVSMSYDGRTVAVGASNFGAAALENTGQVTVFTLSQIED